MNCPDARPLLHAYADGELDLVRSLEVEQHLKACPACAAESQSLQTLRTALQAGDLAYRAPRSLRQRVRELAGPVKRESASRDNDLTWLWKWLAGSATALALATILLRPAGLSGTDALMNEAVASHVRSLMVGHLTDVASSDQHTVKPWFDGKLDFAPEVRDFAEQNFPLVGGRLDYLNGRAVAALVYRHNKHLINVFVWPASDAKAGASLEKNLRGYSLIHREIHGLHYWLVSDLNEKELGELADMMAK